MQCFYVVMGGVVVDFTTVKDEQCQQDLHRNGLKMRSTLTSVACQESKITDIPCKSIRDKSKADILAKGLVCFQVSWIVIQVNPFLDTSIQVRANRNTSIDSYKKDSGLPTDCIGGSYPRTCCLRPLDVYFVVRETS
jgi:hypothetical protein